MRVNPDELVQEYIRKLVDEIQSMLGAHYRQIMPVDVDENFSKIVIEFRRPPSRENILTWNEHLNVTFVRGDSPKECLYYVLLHKKDIQQAILLHDSTEPTELRDRRSSWVWAGLTAGLGVAFYLCF